MMAADENKKRRRPYSVDHRPRCPQHGDTMSAGRSAKLVTYFYCAVDGCRYSTKLVRFSTDGNKHAE